METWRSNHGRRRTARGLVVGSLLSTGVAVGVSQPASATTTATFANGVLSVVGDSDATAIEVSRDPAGVILVNDGTVGVAGGSPTTATTILIQVSGHGGDDVISLDEANGALPRANLSGGSDQDTLTGGSGADQLSAREATTP
jgi:Ca2+-binding RTX toxin-like protein